MTFDSLDSKKPRQFHRTGSHYAVELSCKHEGVIPS